MNPNSLRQTLSDLMQMNITNPAHAVGAAHINNRAVEIHRIERLLAFDKTTCSLPPPLAILGKRI
jgi:hypothetical protein